jgi:hypothetical protein
MLVAYWFFAYLGQILGYLDLRFNILSETPFDQIGQSTFFENWIRTWTRVQARYNEPMALRIACPFAQK